MDPKDEEKTAFMTDSEVFCYKAMLFGLKNAGASYQGLVDQMFKDQKGRIVKVYINNMIIKSKRLEDHVKDIAEMFDVMDIKGMKLNPNKCTFGVKLANSLAS